MFVGRDAEVTLLSARLTDRRLLTLVGAAGVGKTTLATVVAERRSHQFDLGLRSVDLTRISGDDDVHNAIAGQLGYADFDALIASPVDRSVLLLIDNCEHVVDDAADAIAQVLASCEMPTIVATSRAPLDLPQETVISVSPLTPPLPGHDPTDNACVQMFLERARDAGGDPGDDLDAIAQICRHLDGVPLAIELAAARTRSMTTAEICDHLDAQLDLLHRPRFRGASRHRSLRAAIEWSHCLLDEQAATLFARLSVMPGTFDFAAAHAIAADPGWPEPVTRDVLDRLVASSLVIVDTTGTTARYRLLESIRAYAREQLDEQGGAAATFDRLTDHAIERMLDIRARATAAWDATIMADLLGNYPITSAGLRWALSSDDGADRAQLLAAMVWGLIHQAHTNEITELASRAVERWPDPAGPFWADAMATAATGAYLMGNPRRAVELAETVMAHEVASPFAPVTLRRVRGQAEQVLGNSEQAAAWFNEGAELARANGLEAWALELDIDRAAILLNLGRVDEALDLVRSAVTGSEAIRSTITSLWGRGVEAAIVSRTDPATAVALADDVIARSRQIDYPAGLHAALRAQAQARLSLGDVVGAAVSVRELVQALSLNGAVELSIAMGPAIAVLEAGGITDRLDDLAASWAELPSMSMVASGDHPPPAPDGVDLGRGATLRVVREQLDALIEGAGQVSARPDQPRAAAAAGASIMREGDYWSIEFAGRSVIVKHSKGLGDLATLLASPGRDVHCLDLIGAVSVQPDTGAVLDREARRAYEERVRALGEDLAEAEDFGDIGRADRIRAEMDAIVDQLVAAAAVGGRERRAGGDAERARSAVTQRIRGTIRRLGDSHPPLGAHLGASVRTGLWCRYEPDPAVTWTT